MNVSLWGITISTIIAILVGMLPLQNTEQPASQLANAFWMALIRNNWGYSIAWIIFACANDSGGIFKWFLELPCWQPMGRMSLSFYLVHSIYQTVAIGSGKVPLHFNVANLVNMSAIKMHRTFLYFCHFSYTITLVTLSSHFFLQLFSI